MAERRVDRIIQILGQNPRQRLGEICTALRRLEGNDSIPPTSVIIAIKSENERLVRLGQRPKFRTSRNGEERGWIRLEAASEFEEGTSAQKVEQTVHDANKKIAKDLQARLQRMDWRTFESTFLTAVLEKLGFEDVEITQATRDGGKDARVSYKRGLVEAKAIVSAKRWAHKSRVPVEEVRLMRGVQGDEDTAIIITTGQFTADARAEARPSQNQRVVYLIDGDRLVDICNEHEIGIVRTPLPDLLTLDEELFQASEEPEEGDGEVVIPPEVTDPPPQRFRVEMLRDLTNTEIAELTGLARNTVRVYRSDPLQAKELAKRIRSDSTTRDKALRLVARARNS